MKFRSTSGWTHDVRQMQNWFAAFFASDVHSQKLAKETRLKYSMLKLETNKQQKFQWLENTTRFLVPVNTERNVYLTVVIRAQVNPLSLIIYRNEESARG